MRIFILFFSISEFSSILCCCLFFSSSSFSTDWNRYVEFIGCESQFHFMATKKKGFVLSIDRCSRIFIFLSTKETCGSFHHRLIKIGFSANFSSFGCSYFLLAHLHAERIVVLLNPFTSWISMENVSIREYSNRCVTIWIISWVIEWQRGTLVFLQSHRKWNSWK